MEIKFGCHQQASLLSGSPAHSLEQRPLVRSPVSLPLSPRLFLLCMRGPLQVLSNPQPQRPTQRLDIEGACLLAWEGSSKLDEERSFAFTRARRLGHKNSCKPQESFQRLNHSVCKAFVKSQKAELLMLRRLCDAMLRRSIKRGRRHHALPFVIL